MVTIACDHPLSERLMFRRCQDRGSLRGILWMRGTRKALTIKDTEYVKDSMAG